MSITRQTLPLNSDTEIPLVGFGTYLIPAEQAAHAVRTAIGLGYRHIDTAELYGNEQAVGEGIRAALADNGLSREDIFVTTKLWPGHADWDIKPRTEEQAIAEARNSLVRLGLDQVDLYLIHSPQASAQRIHQWDALLKLKDMGLARAIGVSNYNVAHLEEIRTAGLAMPEANQIELHPWSQKVELTAYMHRHHIAPIAYSSLAPLSTWRSAPGQDSRKTDAMRDDEHVFSRLSKKYGVSEAQVLLRWCIQKGYPVLPKSLRRERMEENLKLDGFQIDDNDMALMDRLDRGDGLAWSVGDPTRVS